MKKTLALLLICTMLLAGCAPAAAPEAGAAEASAAEAVRTDLVVGNTGEPDTLNIFQAGGKAINLFVLKNILEPLYTYDADKQLVAVLAEGYESSDDLMEYTVKIKQGVKFQNGEELKASDVVFSVQKSAEGGYMDEFTGLIASTEAVDDYTVKFTLVNPAVLFIENMAQYLYIVSEKEYTERGDDAIALDPSGIGTGAYQFDSWESGVAVKLTAFDGYHGAAPAIKDITIKFIAEASSGVIALETGDVDIYTAPTFLDADNLSKNPEIQVCNKQGETVYYLVMHTQQPPFNDVNVRKAIFHAINRQDICVADYNTVGATPTGTLTIPGSFAYVDTSLSIEQDLELAKEYMAKSAYPDGFDCVLTFNNTIIADVLKDQLAKIGINMEIDLMDFSAMVDVLMSEDQMQMNIMNSSSMRDAGQQLYDKVISTAWINFSKYNNPTVDALLNEYILTKDEARRKAIVAEVQQILDDEMPFVPMIVPNQVMAANAKLKNFTFANGTDIDFKTLSW